MSKKKVLSKEAQLHIQSLQEQVISKIPYSKFHVQEDVNHRYWPSDSTKSNLKNFDFAQTKFRKPVKPSLPAQKKPPDYVKEEEEEESVLLVSKLSGKKNEDDLEEEEILLFTTNQQSKPISYVVSTMGQHAEENQVNDVQSKIKDFGIVFKDNNMNTYDNKDLLYELYGNHSNDESDIEKEFENLNLNKEDLEHFYNDNDDDNWNHSSVHTTTTNDNMNDNWNHSNDNKNKNMNMNLQYAINISSPKEEEEIFDDEAFARMLQEEERLELERDAERKKMQLFEDEQMATKLYSSTNNSINGNGDDETLKLVEVANQINEEERLKIFKMEEEDFKIAQELANPHLKIEEEDARLARLLSVEESQLAERIENEMVQFQSSGEDASMKYARELEKEMLYFGCDPEMESLILAQQLSNEQEFSSQLRLKEEEESLRLARLLQEELDSLSARSLSRNLSEDYRLQSSDLQRKYPNCTLKDCHDALLKANYDSDIAEIFLQDLCINFPTLSSASVMKKEAFKTNNYNNQNKNHSGMKSEYSIETTFTTLLQKYGKAIPAAAIRQAAHDAYGDFDRAETILFQAYGKEAAYVNMHLKSSLESQTRDQQKMIHVTKVGGFPVRLKRELEPEEIEIDDSYLDLARRRYSYNDLIRACQRFGNNNNTIVLRSTPNSTLEQQLLYKSLRRQEEELSDQIAKAFRQKGKANEQSNYHGASEWDKKIAHLKLKLTATSLEAADCLFVHQNPKLVQRLCSTEPDNLDEELKIDLHLLHVLEAESRTFALLVLASIKGWKTLIIITGKGNHSDDRGPKLLPRIESLLKTSKNVVQSYTVGDGNFIVKIKRG